METTMKFAAVIQLLTIPVVLTFGLDSGLVAQTNSDSPQRVDQSPTEPQKLDPQSVLRRFTDAMNAGDTDAALTLWADDAVIINTRGRTITGRGSLRRFLQANITAKQQLDPESVQVVGDKMTWTNRETNDSYRKLNVAPVQIASEMIVRDGMIKSYVGYFPSSEIARIERACATPQGKDVLPNGEPCDRFVEQARAQNARVIGPSTSDKK
jgi:SnoaL-like protein